MIYIHIYILKVQWFLIICPLVFKDFFHKAESRSELVATFLAILELAKSKRIYISDDNDGETEIELMNGGENS